MQRTNQLAINLEDFPELKEQLAHKQIGEACEITVTAQLDEMDDKMAVLSVNEAKTAGDYSEPEAGDGDESQEQAPVAVVMGIAKKKKK